ncbi:hypothetical protein CO230_03790 [Chryseobacterium sp. 6424]|uniref:hypothetical protein n=1 Tax=Chryseobacterium sp. 6424 TaxID=2039166 RepID=UPI000EFB76F6|nr:hypothetical protein [Chryseobacterium sp. 6424]AYO57320.1 hypothetical protein CO230_03790 [Chryseobacterium sp. 6424]
MKKILLLTALFVFNFGFSQKPLTSSLENLDQKFLKKFHIKKDVFDNKTVIYEKKSYGQNIRIKPYLVIKDGLVFYRVGLMFDGYSEWPDMHTFKFLIDDQVYNLPLGETRKKISHQITAVETSNLLLNDEEIEIFRKVGSAKTPVQYRISGNKNTDLKLYVNSYIKITKELYDMLTK